MSYCTVILPVEAGSLSDDGALDAEFDSASDVADSLRPKLRIRAALIDTDAGWRSEIVATATGSTEIDLPDGLFEDRLQLVDEICRRTGTIVVASAEIGDDKESEPRRVLLYLLNPHSPDAPSYAVSKNQTLDEHTEAVVAAVEMICDSLNLEPFVREALVFAALWHDQGKSDPVWQRFACNDGKILLAKSTRYLHPRALGGYRHEFGSLILVLNDEGFQRLDGEQKDLVLHLIASHHGWGRPHFERKAFPSGSDTEECERVAAETIRRFARLQQRFGRWGLARLESLLRCADGMASRNPGIRLREEVKA